MAAAVAKIREQLEEIKRQQTRTAPSLVPQPREVKESKDEPEKPQLPLIQSIVDNRAERFRLLRVVREYGELCQQRAELDKRINQLKPGLKEAAEKYKMDKVDCGEYTLSYYGSGSQRSIKADLLLAAGVAPDVIAACTVETVKAKAIRVAPAGEPETEV